MSKKLLLASNPASRGIPAEGVSFDGTTDYLSRATDLTGNVDSKTFTFSTWVYNGANTSPMIYTTGDGSSLHRFQVYIVTTGIVIYGWNSVGTKILDAFVTIGGILNTFDHMLISIDMNSATNRYVYINDILCAVTWTTYTNALIDFTMTTHTIGAGTTGANKLKGRLSNVFLDYTYRDLSIEANRRLFITADGKPASGLASLNPILYLPMKDASTAHINNGTGGNFVQNGTLDTAWRGANQDNCVASYFDGVADYLSRTSLTGIADGKQFTFSCNFKAKIISNGKTLFSIFNSSALDYPFKVHFSSGSLLLTIGNSTVSVATDLFNTANMVANRLYTITYSYDGAVSNSKKISINGIVQSLTNSVQAWDIGFLQTLYTLSRDGVSSYTDANIGELYFDTKYIDLATSNPFWDSVENKPVPVRKVIANTGVVPLIAMPLDASNAGKNYGTGGDFTVNSGPYVGARGASEFWARSAKFPVSSAATINATQSLGMDTKYMTFIAYFKLNDTPSQSQLFQFSDAKKGLSIRIYDTTRLDIIIRDFGGTGILDKSYTGLSFSVGNTYKLMISIDTTGANPTRVYLNETAIDTTLISSNLLFQYTYETPTDVFIGNPNPLAGYTKSDISFVYLSSQYIDFSQEVNRLKFVDGLGYPLDLSKQIASGAIPKPLFYLPFDDTTNLGKDASGNGNHFTVNGTVTAGADVLG